MSRLHSEPPQRRGHQGGFGAAWCACCLCGLLFFVAGCTGEANTPTPTRNFSAPTMEPSPNPFAMGPPTEAPPDSSNGIGQNDPTAAALPNRDGGALPPLPVGTMTGPRQTVRLTAEDGTLLSGMLYQQEAERQPGVLLLASDANSWSGFPQQLHEAGFTVLVMPLRTGGELDDFHVMLDSLTSGIADPSRIIVVGAAQGADVALAGCAEMAVCLGAALLSPLDAVALPGIMASFNPRPLFVTASQQDAESYAVAEALDAAATSTGKLLQPLENAGRGTAILLNRPDVGDLLIEWLRRVAS